MKSYFAPLLKWWWLIAAAVVVAGTIAFMIARQLPSVYLSRTTLVIGRTIYEPNPDTSQLYLTQELGRFYVNVLAREPIQDATKTALGLAELPQYEARVIPNSPFLEILVTDTDPVRAQLVAKELASQLINSMVEQKQTTDSTFLNQQITETIARIKTTTDEIATRQQELSGMTSAIDISQTQDELTALDQKLTYLQNIYANLIAGSRDTAVNQVSVFEAATMPINPIGPNRLLIIAASIFGAGILSVGVAYGIEMMDNSIKTAEEVIQITQTSVIGNIHTIEQNKSTYKYVNSKPNSWIADDFRLLSANLEYHSLDRPLQTILVTSAGERDGKSTIAANLAASLAQTDKRVILVDADLRRYTIQRAFLTPNGKEPSAEPVTNEVKGINDIFMEKISTRDALVTVEDMAFKVLYVGSPPKNPVEILGSYKMDILLNELRELAEFVIIDGPPLFLPDTIVLARKVDGLLIVARPGFTQRKDLAFAMEQVNQMGNKIIGIVLNHLPTSKSHYYTK
jgi:capsular exopolysaccharide synthesis family protein